MPSQPPEARGGLNERFVICGPPGSGKTTYVSKRRVAGDVVWDLDVVIAVICGVKVHEHESQMIGLAGRIRDALVKWVAENRTSGSVYVIVTSKETAQCIARKIGGRVVVLDVPAEECKRRLEAEGRLKPSHFLAFENWDKPQTEARSRNWGEDD